MRWVNDAETVDIATEQTLAVPNLECLLFSCCGQYLGCETSDLVKIIRPPRLVPLPRTSGVVSGVFNYRGRIIGAIDIQPLLGMETAKPSAWQWLVVLKGKQFFAGLLIDEILGIEEIPETALINTAVDAPDFLPKSFTVNGRTVDLLSVNSLLSLPAVLVIQ
jgi:chemotaxis signal transduction protein